MPTTSSGSSQSFIPHEVPVVGTPRTRRPGGVELLFLITLVIFVASAALAVGVFLYGEYLQSSATSKIDQLKRAKAAFEPSLINELTRLDDRMRSAGEVLGNHIAPSALFKMLEQTTIVTMMFKSLDFNAQSPQNITIDMEGVAASVNSIALQADLFSKGGMVTSPIFSDIDRGFDGVHFSVSALINPEAINFSRLVVVPGSAIPEFGPSNPIFGTPSPASTPESGAQGEPPQQ